MSAALLLLAERAKLLRAAVPHGAYFDFLRDNGLALARFGDPDPIEDACGALAVTTIRPQRTGGFEFAPTNDEQAVVAAVIEALGPDRRPVDLVAWPVGSPTRVRSMFGRVDMLGAWNVGAATSYTFGAPLCVWRTPLRWLQAGGKGVVVVDPKSAARRLLDAPGRIAGEDRDHTKEIAASVAALFDASRFVAPVSPSLREAA